MITIMDTRIQFRVDEETKRLAQQMAESQGYTLSDACRNLTMQLAAQQKKAMSHDAWLTEQVNLAFEKLDSGKAVYLDHDEAKSNMAQRKAKIRSRG
jgi:antitoxin component of RelBE/YafQ-DinJ toxin-antitoxin module